MLHSKEVTYLEPTMQHNIKTRLRLKAYLLMTIMFLGVIGPMAFINPEHVYASQTAGASYIRFDRMKAATAPGQALVVFTTSSATFTETLFKLTLDSSWVSATNFSATAGNYTVSTSGLPAGVTAMPGVATATNVTSNTISFPITDLTASTKYGFFITGTGLLLNPSASNTITHILFTTNAVPTTNDTISVISPVIADDQIVVSATVAPSLTFVFGANIDAIGTITTGAVKSSTGVALTITTNAAHGWTAWVKDSNQGLISSAASKTIATSGTIDAAPSTLSAGTEGYALDVDLTTNNSGSAAISAEYDGNTTAKGGTLASTLQTIASATGPANGDVITLIERAAISGTTPAATDYTDTLTVVGAGNF